MAELHLDIIDGTKLVEVGDNVYQYVVSAIVSGLSGLADARLLDALTTTAVTNDGAPARGMPRYYSPHRVIPGVVCLRREAECVEGDNTAVRVLCFYDVPTADQQPPADNAPPQIEGGVTIQEFETELDANGNEITVTFTPPLAPGEVGPPAPITQHGTIKKQVPISYLRYTWRQTISPGLKARIHVGTMNSDNFDVGPNYAGDPPGTWLCAGITFNSNDLGASWNVTAEFLYNSDTWAGVIAWIDPETNRIPLGVTFTNGLKKITIYKSSTFADIFT